MSELSHTDALSASKIAAEKLLGEIHWQDSDSGFCRCPGRDLHSTKNAKRDCAVYVTPGRAPTIYCQHNSCGGAVEDANRKLRSAIGKLQADPAHRPTPEEIRKWRREARERRLQRMREQRARELTSKVMSRQLAKIIENYPWPIEQVMADSPIPPHKIWSYGKPDRVPEWTRLIDLIFHPGDLIFVGEWGDCGSRYFKTKEEWLRLYQRPNAPQLEPKEGLFLSMWSWKPGSTRKTKENRLHRRALVLESDTLGENVFPVFRWLQINLKLRAIVFSGNKSFHAWFDPPGEKLEKQLKEISSDLQLDSSMFDKSFGRLPGVTRPDAPYETWRQEICYLDRKEVAA